MDTPVSFARREREILLLTLRGNEAKAIAEELEIAVRTVNTRTLSMARRAGVSGRPQLVTWAYQHPEVLRRYGTSSPGLHPPGCSCSSPHCLMMREAA
jgi:DNA-binding CsgD family transcriptional regulator